MLSKNKIKHLQQLSSKKQRSVFNEFLIEGSKIFKEAVHQKWNIKEVYATEEYMAKESELALKFNMIPATENQLSSLGNLENNNSVAALLEIKNTKFSNFKWQDTVCLVLDNIKDPGNLGTIIRRADWFGIQNILCSEATVDVYNPKVIQATMGSISRVNVNYVDLATFIESTSLTVFGTFMNGENIYNQKLPNQGVIVMGNEANGISGAIEKIISRRITIPRFGDLQQTESLNVATATAIILNEFRRAEFL